jgi:2Fe-2S ferredoxin
MPVVTIVPGDIRIEVATGETLAQAAWRQGYHWPTTCWGEMQCMVCAAVVVGGEHAAEPASSEEVAAISERMPRFRQQALSSKRRVCERRLSRKIIVIELVSKI